MTGSVPEDIAMRVARLAAGQQLQALAYVETLERAGRGDALAAFAGTILPTHLAAMAAVIDAACEAS